MAHGDLHPFNLLVTERGPVLIDWTVSRVASPAFTVAFTHLVLSNPPLAVPRPATPVLRMFGRTLARRFLASYRARTAGTTAFVADADLEWHRRVHALRILAELATWRTTDVERATGHPWLVIEPAAARLIGV